MTTDNDVVVTGIGATTPIGGTAPDTWQAMLDGRIGVTANTAPWVEKFGLPVAIHAPLAAADEHNVDGVDTLLARVAGRNGTPRPRPAPE